MTDELTQRGYEDDLHAWLDCQATLLRDRKIDQADLDNIAEELEGLSRSERRALESSLRLIVLHMLKLLHQPERATQSWRNTIQRERLNVEKSLEYSPSLTGHIQDLFDKAYRDGRRLAASETGIPEAFFPEQPEFNLDQARDIAYMPLGPGFRVMTASGSVIGRLGILPANQKPGREDES